MTAKTILPIVHWRTQQNTPAYFVHTKTLPMVDLRIAFQAGAARDLQAKGLAHLTNCLLDEGSQTCSADALAQNLDAVGARYGADTRHDFAYVGLRSLSDLKFLSPALATFSEIIGAPAFSDEALSRVKKQINTDLQEALQEPATQAAWAFYKHLYADHPYGHPISGTKACIDSLTRSAVIDFYKKYYTAQNACIVLVGDINTAFARHLAQDLANLLPCGEKAGDLPPARLASAGMHSIDFPAEQTSIYLGQVAIDRHDPDYFPLQVGNYILGGSSLVSRLGNQIREARGLAYGIYSNFTPLWARGPFFIHLQTQNAQAQSAMALVQAVLAAFIQKGPTDAELRAAQKYLVGSFPLQLAGNAKITSQLMHIGCNRLPMDYLDTYIQNVQAVTCKAIREAFAHHVPQAQLVQISVGKNS